MSRKVHLRLVERFDELHVGARVFVVACLWCGKSYEDVIAEVAYKLGDWPDGVPDFATGWGLTFHCDGGGIPTALSPSPRGAIAQRRVYLILDGAEDPEATETTAPKERERTSCR